MKPAFFVLLLLLTSTLPAQTLLRGREFSINGFRNPAIGLEYREGPVSVHGGLYLTNFVSGQTTRFVKAGVTLWFLPVGKKPNPSSFYLQMSYLRGLNRAYANENAFSPDLGFRWMVWKGLNLRVGVVGVFGRDKASILWTPGISWSFFSKSGSR